MLNSTFKGFITLGLVILVLLQSHMVFSQTGAWISQPISQDMSGDWYHDCGETVAALTRQYSRYIYFFDINSSQWTVVDFDMMQTIRGLTAKGNVAMAYSDSLIVGYSGITSQWDTVYYKGKPLDPNPWMSDPSWGCGENLAWFVTTQYVYIFDSQLGEWKTQPYSIPFTYTSGNGHFWSKGDYAGIIIYDIPLNIYYDLAYSLPQHNFAVLTDGGYVTSISKELDHGFVAYWHDGNIYKRIGYSAFTNQFDVLTLNSEPCEPSVWYAPSQVINKTVLAFSITEFLSPPSNYRLHSYGFDTRSGVWVEHSWDYDESQWDFTTCWKLAGQFASLELLMTSNDQKNHLIFSGTNNAFSMLNPGLSSYSGGIQGGGTVSAEYDTSHIWFYSASTGASHLIPYFNEEPDGGFSGENFAIVFTKYKDNPDSLHLYIFHEPQDRVKSKVIPRRKYGTSANTPYLIAFATYGINNEVFFYSGIVNDYSIISFPSPVQPNQSHSRGVLSYVTTGDYFTLYDATSNMAYEIPQSIPTLNINSGNYIALIINTSNSVYTYSSLTQQWQELNIPEGINSIYCGDYVGLIKAPEWEKKYYAYNGYGGNLVPLTVSGNWVNTLPIANGKTALVVRDSIIYAFSPGITTSTSPTQSPYVPEQIILHQNYPNPFNPVTNIRFTLPEAADVTLTVYDILGREVKTLVNERKAAGKHIVHWDGTDNSGQAVGSGVYYYRLTAGEYSSVKKMLLVR